MQSGARWVLHLDMDAFFASVEQLTRPTLRGRPVLVGGTGQRGVVAGASYEARRYGARSAMPMHQARRLVGLSAVVLPPRGQVYQVASRHVFSVVREVIPVIEQLSLDEAFGEPAELAGASVAEAEEFCTRLRERVLERTGLVASVGAGSGKQVAKIASGLAKPHGQRVIGPDERDALMAALPVRKLWGIGPVAQERLRKVGVETIGDFAALDPVEVGSLLGTSVGPALHRLARGIDDRPVAERAESKQISAETTFQHDLMTRAEVRAAVQATGEAACTRLTNDGRGARTVVVKLRKADMSTVTRSSTLPYATTARETLIAAAQRLVIDPAEIGPIRLVGVGLAGLSAVQQTVLFPDLDATDQSETAPAPAPDRAVVELRPGADVRHDDFGHGWVQGIGHGVVSVRFETRISGRGPMRTFAVADPALAPADPRISLDWPELLADATDGADAAGGMT
ncbi:DNA polymerase IV [Rhodococcus sp. D2-41]|uniref:DNA polymerase IV n=1 Tax=Speluncibacter jeojiensis TaxID=2710754 RepID=A0A9X4RCD8_9ACTN|nr:DNA polymerase IV [Rhodococcus sp. D2-41]MDG3012008.1 DNA polymerase IV [Rhodococcus sp. D2-41]MDG3013463.1 DNA polymerase IV [Corynebacteriales bacterium D3-21]